MNGPTGFALGYSLGNSTSKCGGGGGAGPWWMWVAILAVAVITCAGLLWWTR